MHRNIMTSLILITGLVIHAGAFARPPADASIDLTGNLNCPVITADGGTAFLQVALTTGSVRMTDRRPMNIAVVLDRSGSMGSQGKIEYARTALHRLLDQLTGSDILSLVVYDDVVDVMRPAARVRNKREIATMIDRIMPRNSTNLGGGMMEGFRQAARYAGTEYVNRVILLSDGLANTGMTDPAALNAIARRYRSQAISLTSMGVGLEYNENLMVGLSESGGGNYYFIESPNTLAAIMRKELTTVSAVVAQNALLEVGLGKGVEIRDVIGAEYTSCDGVVSIPLGDLYGSDRRDLTLELVIPPGRGTLEVARGVLRSDDRRSPGRSPSFTASVRYTRDVAEMERHRDQEAQSKVDVARSTRKVDEAMKALDEGRDKDAERVLGDARQILSASPAATAGGAAAEAVYDQMNTITGYEDTLRANREDLRRAKKAIQYDNYQVQKRR